ncbi:adaptin c-terminal domain-containing protein [Besnoitia besnoiti]|uniref:Adaptin c-terminal domain-containing protein n=1 Tax=Besnoitia besnoiti TaxID=94643 RepID=A0A2A9M5Z6_BESBE|nr:adaptin c-terminal domain-containing protein [Besnoitia besnoiti]PFH31067.1 adaptin c-terminal domain-containing protein [Besnoitia besnoiti]
MRFLKRRSNASSRRRGSASPVSLASASIQSRETTQEDEAGFDAPSAIEDFQASSRPSPQAQKTSLGLSRDRDGRRRSSATLDTLVALTAAAPPSASLTREAIATAVSDALVSSHPALLLRGLLPRVLSPSSGASAKLVFLLLLERFLLLSASWRAAATSSSLFPSPSSSLLTKLLPFLHRTALLLLLPPRDGGDDGVSCSFFSASVDKGRQTRRGDDSAAAAAVRFWSQLAAEHERGLAYFDGATPRSHLLLCGRAAARCLFAGLSASSASGESPHVTKKFRVVVSALRAAGLDCTRHAHAHGAPASTAAAAVSALASRPLLGPVSFQFEALRAALPALGEARLRAVLLPQQIEGAAATPPRPQRAAQKKRQEDRSASDVSDANELRERETTYGVERPAEELEARETSQAADSVGDPEAAFWSVCRAGEGGSEALEGEDRTSLSRVGGGALAGAWGVAAQPPRVSREGRRPSASLGAPRGVSAEQELPGGGAAAAQRSARLLSSGVDIDAVTVSSAASSPSSNPLSSSSPPPSPLSARVKEAHASVEGSRHRECTKDRRAACDESVCSASSRSSTSIASSVASPASSVLSLEDERAPEEGETLSAGTEVEERDGEDCLEAYRRLASSLPSPTAGGRGVMPGRPLLSSQAAHTRSFSFEKTMGVFKKSSKKTDAGAPVRRQTSRLSSAAGGVERDDAKAKVLGPERRLLEDFSAPRRGESDFPAFAGDDLREFSGYAASDDSDALKTLEEKLGAALSSAEFLQEISRQQESPLEVSAPALEECSTMLAGCASVCAKKQAKLRDEAAKAVDQGRMEDFASISKVLDQLSFALDAYEGGKQLLELRQREADLGVERDRGGLRPGSAPSEPPSQPAAWQPSSPASPAGAESCGGAAGGPVSSSAGQEDEAYGREGDTGEAEDDLFDPFSAKKRAPASAAATRASPPSGESKTRGDRGSRRTGSRSGEREDEGAALRRAAGRRGAAGLVRGRSEEAERSRDRGDRAGAAEDDARERGRDRQRGERERQEGSGRKRPSGSPPDAGGVVGDERHERRADEFGSLSTGLTSRRSRKKDGRETRDERRRGDCSQPFPSSSPEPGAPAGAAKPAASTPHTSCPSVGWPETTSEAGEESGSLEFSQQIQTAGAEKADVLTPFERARSVFEKNPKKSSEQLPASLSFPAETVRAKDEKQKESAKQENSQGSPDPFGWPTESFGFKVFDEEENLLWQGKPARDPAPAGLAGGCDAWGGDLFMIEEEEESSDAGEGRSFPAALSASRSGGKAEFPARVERAAEKKRAKRREGEAGGVRKAHQKEDSELAVGAAGAGETKGEKRRARGGERDSQRGGGREREIRDTEPSEAALKLDAFDWFRAASYPVLPSQPSSPCQLEDTTAAAKRGGSRDSQRDRMLLPAARTGSHETEREAPPAAGAPPTAGLASAPRSAKTGKAPVMRASASASRSRREGRDEGDVSALAPARSARQREETAVKRALAGSRDHESKRHSLSVSASRHPARSFEEDIRPTHADASLPQAPSAVFPAQAAGGGEPLRASREEPVKGVRSEFFEPNSAPRMNAQRSSSVLSPRSGASRLPLTGLASELPRSQSEARRSPQVCKADLASTFEDFEFFTTACSDQTDSPSFPSPLGSAQVPASEAAGEETSAPPGGSSRRRRDKQPEPVRRPGGAEGRGEKKATYADARTAGGEGDGGRRGAALDSGDSGLLGREGTLGGAAPAARRLSDGEETGRREFPPTQRSASSQWPESRRGEEAKRARGASREDDEKASAASLEGERLQAFEEKIARLEEREAELRALHDRESREAEASQRLLRDRLDNAMQAWEGERRAFRKREDEHVAKVQALSGRLVEADEEAKKKKEENERLKSNLQEKCRALENAKDMWLRESARASALNDRLDEAEEKIADLQTQLATLSAKYSEALREVEAFKVLVNHPQPPSLPSLATSAQPPSALPSASSSTSFASSRRFNGASARDEPSKAGERSDEAWSLQGRSETKRNSSFFAADEFWGRERVLPADDRARRGTRQEFAEVTEVTNGFGEDNMLGEGVALPPLSLYADLAEEAPIGLSQFPVHVAKPGASHASLAGSRDSSRKSRGVERADATLPGVVLVSDNLRRLLLVDDALLFEDETIQIGIKSTYQGLAGQVSIYYGNKMSGLLQNVTISFLNPQSESLVLHASPLPAFFAPKQQVCQDIALECIAPFDAWPSLRLQFLLADNTPRQVDVTLPLAVNKFMEARDMGAEEFFLFWKNERFVLKETSCVLNLHPRFRGSLLAVARASQLGRALALCRRVDPNPENLVLAGAFPPSVCDKSIPLSIVLVRLEIGRGRHHGKCRLVVRSDCHVLSRGIRDLISLQIAAPQPAALSLA